MAELAEASMRADSSPTYIVGSGWWSSDKSSEDVNPNRKSVGDPFIRSVPFFDLWFESIEANTSPHKIIVVDSNAPNKPSVEKRERVEWVSLPFNAKHSTDHIGRWSGWTRSVIVSATYALASDCDYFVYVEQDCLLKGKGIIEHSIRQMNTGVMFGDGAGTPQPLQQSFFIIRSDRLRGFVRNLCAIDSKDCELSPEWKFVCALWPPFVFAANRGFLSNRKTRERVLKFARNRFFEHLPFGVGRARPIQFVDDFFYFQHGTQDEITQFVKECAV